MSKKRNVPAHGRKAARSRRPRKRRFLVVAGGAVTEKQYFKQLESLYYVIIDYQQTVSYTHLTLPTIAIV